MSVKQMFQLESETVTEAPVKIPFEYANRESIPEGKEVGNCIVVSPIKVVTWFK
ncbi:hypothetical protein FACS1894181_02880 [Bacteroidia bacterium]|nr:hypothetical protein FACS1894181_02880 [Bacteroidia bacterium]